MKRSLSILAALLVCATLLAGNPVGLVRSHAQRASLRSLERVDEEGRLYEMDYRANYRLDRFLRAEPNSQDVLKTDIGRFLLRPLKTLRTMKKMNPACSAFQTVTPEGDVICGRNFDYPFRDAAAVLVRTAPRGGYRSISFSALGFLDYGKGSLDDGSTELSFAIAAPYALMDGLNEKGFCVSVLYLPGEGSQQEEPGRRNIVTTVAMRLLLDRAADVDEALALLGQYNFYADGDQTRSKEKCNYHFLLSDAGGRSVVLEYIKVDGRWVMSVVDEHIVTNHYRSAGWQKKGNGFDRYRTAKKALDAAGNVMDEAAAMALLQQLSFDQKGRDGSRTQWSVVYNLTRGTATVCMGRDYTRQYEFGI